LSVGDGEEDDGLIQYGGNDYKQGAATKQDSDGHNLENVRLKGGFKKEGKDQLYQDNNGNIYKFTTKGGKPQYNLLVIVSTKDQKNDKLTIKDKEKEETKEKINKADKIVDSADGIGLTKEALGKAMQTPKGRSIASKIGYESIKIVKKAGDLMNYTKPIIKPKVFNAGVKKVAKNLKSIGKSIGKKTLIIAPLIIYAEIDQGTWNAHTVVDAVVSGTAIGLVTNVTDAAIGRGTKVGDAVNDVVEDLGELKDGIFNLFEAKF